MATRLNVSEVSTIKAFMDDARNGADYEALFKGKKLAFKFTAAMSEASELKDMGKEIVETTGDVLEAVEDNPIVSAILEVAAVIKAGGKLFLEAMRLAFHKLVKVFTALREALEAVFRPFDIALTFAIDLLIQVLPNAFVEFAKGLIAALLPFAGQIHACVSMFSSVVEVVRGAIEQVEVMSAGAVLDAKNRFSTAARTAIERLMDGEMARSATIALIDTANAGASAAGLIFSGNLVGMVSGLASAIAKLCLKVADIVLDLRQMHNANALLERINRDFRHDVNPVELFEAAPVLGCIYLASATQSSLVANTGFLDSLAVKLAMSDQGWMAQYRAKVSQLEPMRQKARLVVKSSRLELTAAAPMGFVFDTTVKDVVKDSISGMLGDWVVDAGGRVLVNRKILPPAARV